MNAPDARPAEILPLLRDVRASLGQRDVRHGVRHPVIEPGRADGQIAHWRKTDAGFAPNQTLGPQLIVGEREYGADPELAIQLVERRRAKSLADIAPRAEPVRDLVAGRGA